MNRVKCSRETDAYKEIFTMESENINAYREIFKAAKQKIIGQKQGPAGNLTFQLLLVFFSPLVVGWRSSVKYSFFHISYQLILNPLLHIYYLRILYNHRVIPIP